MNAVKIREAAKKEGFIIVVETHATIVIKKKGKTTSINIDACNEKNLARALSGKAPRKGAAAKAAEKAPEIPSPPPAETPEDNDAPPPLTFLEQVEVINGIGPKTAQELYEKFTTIESLMTAVMGGESGLSATIDNLLIEEFS